MVMCDDWYWISTMIVFKMKIPENARFIPFKDRSACVIDKSIVYGDVTQTNCDMITIAFNKHKDISIDSYKKRRENREKKLTEINVAYNAIKIEIKKHSANFKRKINDKSCIDAISGDILRNKYQNEVNLLNCNIYIYK
eukprot:357167_1